MNFNRRIFNVSFLLKAICKIFQNLQLRYNKYFFIYEIKENPDLFYGLH